jgi:hypothetical protein
MLIVKIKILNSQILLSKLILNLSSILLDILDLSSKIELLSLC